MHVAVWYHIYSECKNLITKEATEAIKAVVHTVNIKSVYFSRPL